MPISRSPIEKTFANGSGRGSTKMSPRKLSVVAPVAIAELVKSVVGNTATPLERGDGVRRGRHEAAVRDDRGEVAQRAER